MGQSAAQPNRPVNAACPAPRAPLHEAFVPADCEACWAATGPAPQGWRLDWITPAGPQAAMAVAAMPEAAERQARAQALQALPSPAQASASAVVTATPATVSRWPRGWRLQAGTGPAWQGYMGLNLQLRPSRGAAPLPAGASGWLALVEDVPAGSEGSAQARTLVRAVAGPLPLDARQPSSHLRAMRLPDSARAERLGVRAWVESASGQVLAMAADRCAAR